MLFPITQEISNLFTRRLITCNMSTATIHTTGIILGVYKTNDNYEFTNSAKNFIGDFTKINDFIKKSKYEPSVGTTRSFFNSTDKADCLILTGLGTKCEGFCHKEQLDLKKENVRIAIGNALKECYDLKIDTVKIDPCSEPKAVGEVVALSSFFYDELKSKKQTHKIKASLLDTFTNNQLNNEFEEGKILGDGQNFARYLSETPANLMTPTIAGETIKKQFEGLENVKVIVRDKKWIEEHKMGLFLSVAQGSEQPPVLVEIHYNGANNTNVKPIGLVGKGITFDSGGISIKPSLNMHEMKADMQGGACVAASLYSVAKLKLKCNVIGIIPFTENMPSGRATKPGDVHFSISGKSVEIQNTDAEGRLVLADALEYIQTFEPTKIIDLATLTGAICIALGGCCSAIYTHDDALFKELESAGHTSGDRFWRMPLFKYYQECMKSSVADLNNISKSRAAGSCTAAGYLSEFVTLKSWAHLDIAGTMSNNDEVKYFSKGMSGRPTRSIVEFLKMQQE